MEEKQKWAKRIGAAALALASASGVGKYFSGEEKKADAHTQEEADQVGSDRTAKKRNAQQEPADSPSQVRADDIRRALREAASSQHPFNYDSLKENDAISYFGTKMLTHSDNDPFQVDPRIRLSFHIDTERLPGKTEQEIIRAVEDKFKAAGMEPKIITEKDEEDPGKLKMTMVLALNQGITEDMDITAKFIQAIKNMEEASAKLPGIFNQQDLAPMRDKLNRAYQSPKEMSEEDWQKMVEDENRKMQTDSGTRQR